MWSVCDLSSSGTKLRAHLDDLVGEREQTLVVRGDQHGATAFGETADQTKDSFDLDVVEVCGRLVGENQQRIERKGACDRDPLLLSAAELVRPMCQPILEPDAFQQRDCPSCACRRLHTGRAHRAPTRSRLRSGWAPG